MSYYSKNNVGGGWKVYWSGMAYIGITVGLLLLNEWVGIIWLLATGIGFYALLISDERDNKRRGRYNRRLW